MLVRELSVHQTFEGIHVSCRNSLTKQENAFINLGCIWLGSGLVVPKGNLVVGWLWLKGAWSGLGRGLVMAKPGWVVAWSWPKGVW